MLLVERAIASFAQPLVGLIAAVLRLSFALMMLLHHGGGTGGRAWALFGAVGLLASWSSFGLLAQLPCSARISFCWQFSWTSSVKPAHEMRRVAPSSAKGPCSHLHDPMSGFAGGALGLLLVARWGAQGAPSRGVAACRGGWTTAREVPKTFESGQTGAGPWGEEKSFTASVNKSRPDRQPGSTETR